MELHIIPIGDDGHRHTTTRRCKCKPDLTNDRNPKCPVFTHRHLGPSRENRFTIKANSAR